MQQVHNGIEYGDMQMIGECYDILKVNFTIAINFHSNNSQ